MDFIFRILALLLLLLKPASLFVAAATVEHDGNFVPDAVLRVAVAEMKISCLESRPTILVNGTLPGPQLRISEGKTTWIRVYNDMDDKNLTMHWHGLTMAAAPFADGTPAASQWAIPPNHFFDYELHVPLGMAGTYFYHSHVGFQAITAGGPLIVEDTKAPYTYDGEKTVFLGDAFVKDDETIEKGLLANPFVWSGEASAILVNGQGGGEVNGSYCGVPLSIFHVEPGKTYRLRLICAAALSYVSLAIEDHEVLTIIEADGSYSEPVNTSFIELGSGGRYSVLLRTKDKPEKEVYYMQLESRERPNVTRGFAVLSYTKKTEPAVDISAPREPIMTLPPTVRGGFLEYQLHPLTGHSTIAACPSAKEVTRRVTMTIKQVDRGHVYWRQNSYSWTEDVPKQPYLVSLYSNDAANFPSMDRALKNNGIDPVTQAFPAEIGEVLEIVIQNTGSDRGGVDVHPIHAHGAHYYDLGSGNGTYDAAANDAKWAAIGKSPMLRDTTMLYRDNDEAKRDSPQGWRAWRLRITQPGVWMIHCHVLQHMVMGMQTLWVMGNASDVMKVDIPDVEGYLSYGGSAYGNSTNVPSMVHYWDNWFLEQKRSLAGSD